MTLPNKKCASRLLSWIWRTHNGVIQETYDHKAARMPLKNFNHVRPTAGDWGNYVAKAQNKHWAGVVQSIQGGLNKINTVPIPRTGGALIKKFAPLGSRWLKQRLGKSQLRRNPILVYIILGLFLKEVKLIPEQHRTEK